MSLTIVSQISKLINKETVDSLLKIEKEGGVQSVFRELKKNNRGLVKELCIKNNLSYPEFIASLKIYRGS